MYTYMYIIPINNTLGVSVSLPFCHVLSNLFRSKERRSPASYEVFTWDWRNIWASKV